ncbi:MAG: phosphomannomutase/phosphoglucomutase [Alphaproteobacteria bacterium]|nr:phosphomannomutase/phosphoglucomutase [Alphaproteobacteria bacterium]
MPQEGAHIFSPTLLREYDIRGIVGDTLGEADARALGRAFGTFVRRRTGRDTHICVGYDGRLSSPALCDALILSLTDTGARVENIGLGPSPMLYFAVKSRQADAGIMITGSHNPADYNGFKMMLYGEPVYGQLIQDIGTLAAHGDFETGAGHAGTIDIQDAYTARLLQDHTGTRPLTIAWDAGNGAAGEILRRLTARLPGNHILLHDEIDGTFPNHHPDPTVDENLRDLQKAVRDHQCDLGIAFDGDGDRIGVVDENGAVLRCDILMTLYAREVLSRHPGAAIVGDVKCSQVMFDEIARLGGRPVVWKTGHSLIKAKMAELKAPLAGELSGHIFFADQYYGYDDALYCAVRLLNLVSAAGGGLSTLTSHLPVLHNTPEIRFAVKESEKFALVPRVIENIKAAGNRDLTIGTIDGLRVSGPDGWWILRPSNTQDVLVFRAESHSADGLERLKRAADSEIRKTGYGLPYSE